MIKRKDGFSGERALVLPASIIHTMENNPLANALHITDIGYYPRAEHHFRKRETPISQYVFIYCVEGRGWFSVNDERYEIRVINALFYLRMYLIVTEPMTQIHGQFI